MAIISQVGRRSLKVRCLIIFVYSFLVIGSLTTVYPFAMMLSSSVTSVTDYEEQRIVPRYLYSDSALMTVYLEDKYRQREQFDLLKFRYEVREPFTLAVGGQTISRIFGKFYELEGVLEDFDADAPEFRRRVADWEEFRDSLPLEYKDTFFHTSPPLGDAQVAFQNFLTRKYPTMELLGRAIGEEVISAVAVVPPFEAYDRHGWQPDEEPKTREWQLCRRQLPGRFMNVMTVRPLYQRHLYATYGEIARLNDAWATSYEYFWQVPWKHHRPAGPEGDDWERFVRFRYPMRYARLDIQRCRSSWLSYIAATYDSIEEYNGKVGAAEASLEAVPLSEIMPREPLLLYDWQRYYELHAPVDGIVLDTADARFERFLLERYGAVDALNEAWATAFASLHDVTPPWREADHADFAARKGAIRRGFLLRNYVYVVKAIFLQGRAMANTLILVTLTVLAQITINPLAAYALSRYRLSYAPKVLIFLLATMAFPAQVTMIPNFLMIRDMGLLNTFGALVLPGLASGYYIFLLKGFFDSLPQELYEAASIDGASEFRMFWTMTLPLSTPVLAVIALFAFGTAYGSFLWALTTCQDPRMWTLMVFLHQFQYNSQGTPFVVLAALVLAALPTAVVFLSAQKVLMRGIVVPSMK